MFKLVFPAIMCAAMCFPMMAAAQDCGCCDPDPCVKTRKKLVMVCVQKERCGISRECVTDECGCSRKKFVRTKKCVTVKRPQLVDVAVDPCRRNILQKIAGKLGSRCCNNDCCDSAPCCDAPAPCCDAPAPCCGSPAPCGCN